MTEYDKKRFDEIFHSDKYFKNVSDVDMLRTAAECYKLYDYINGINAEKILSKNLLRTEKLLNICILHIG